MILVSKRDAMTKLIDLYDILKRRAKVASGIFP